MSARMEKIEYFRKRLQEVKESQQAHMMKAGEFDKEFQDWLRSEGTPENGHLIDLIAHFSKSPIIT